MTRVQAGYLTSSSQRHVAPAALSQPTTVWWLNPAVLFTAVAIGTLLPAVALSDSSYSTYGTPKYLDLRSLGLAILACGMVAGGVMLGSHVGAAPRRISSATRHSLVPWFYLASGLTVIGYVVWIASAIRNGLRPGHVAELLAGVDHEAFLTLKTEIFTTVPGISTCTQFGLLAVMLAGVLLQRDTRFWKPLVATILGLAAARAVIYSERLALIEVAVVLGVVLLRTRVLNRRLGPAGHMALLVAPVVGIALLLALMAGTEYFRSWQYYQNDFDSLLSFTANRLAGYYSTSHNNGAMAWNMTDGWPVPYYTLEWFWKFPLVRPTPLGYEQLVGFDPELTHAAMLEQWGNPEFNNPGGLFGPTIDFGVIGGALFWLAFGLVAGRLYRGFVTGSLAGLLLYPILVLTMFELPRYLYLCTVRPFPAIALIFFILWRVSAQSTSSAREVAHAN